MNISPFLTPGRIEGTHMKNVNMCNVTFPAGRVIVRHGKNFNAAIFSDTIKSDNCQTLHDGTTHQALPSHGTFSDFDVLEDHSSIKQFKLKRLHSYRI